MMVGVQPCPAQPALLRQGAEVWMLVSLRVGLREAPGERDEGLLIVGECDGRRSVFELVDLRHGGEAFFPSGAAHRVRAI